MTEMKDYSAEQIIKFFSEKDSKWWEKEGQGRALALFHEAAERVPAYKDFLEKHTIDHTEIKTWEDFQTVPLTSKKDYLKKYPIEQLCWDGTVATQLVYTSTSGSTGEPFYFPRSVAVDVNASIIHEMFLKNSSHGVEGPTLVIIAFGMGIWIGGLITYKAFEIAGQRGGYPISIITPGVNKAEVLNALERVAPHYKQVILAGYPPIVKDIIDEGIERGIDFKKLNMRLLTAAEAYTENFRSYLAEKAGVENLFVDIMSIYGSADIGAMAFETPTAILARRLSMKDEELFKNIFVGAKKTPTLAQYNPLQIQFESVNGEVVLTGTSAIPLVRYAIGDNGGVLSHEDLMGHIKTAGIDWDKEVKASGVKDQYQLPFVYVYERNDFSTTLYGLQIYPETIREALLKDCLNPHVTGKFSMATKFDDEQNQYLEINVELKKGVAMKENGDILCKDGEENLIEAVTKEITEFLKSKNSEFNELSKNLKERAIPRVVLWPAEHPTHFKPGTKQQWIQK
jgi:phenylacetate-CoA ligase